MNYFQFYNIPITFTVDEAALKRTFYANSKKYHPDFYTLESEEKQQEILELSTLNNEAYKTLKDADKRMKYVLELKNALGEEGSNKIPQDFLMEMMDINEQLMEYKFDPSPEKLKTINEELRQLENALDMEVSPIFTKFNSKTPNPTNLQTVKSYYLKNQYLNNLKNNLNG